MSTIDLVLPALHPAQREIVRKAKRFTVVNCGRRFGKSSLALELLTDKALDGKPVAYFAPTYKMLAPMWRRFKEALAPIIVRPNEQEKRLELLTGGSLDFWSLEKPDSARGQRYARIVVDEAAVIRDGEAWPAALRPTLADFVGDAFFLSTPKGHNWYWQLFNLGLDPLQREWAAFSYPTSANPFIAPSEIESARELLPSRLFEQEYLAQFIEDGGGVFRGAAAVSTCAALDRPETGKRYVMGLDWGKSNDFTVASVWDASARREVWLDRFNQVGWAVQRGRIQALAKHFNVARVIAESNSIGGPNIEALVADGVPVTGFETTATSKGPLIESLALAVERAEITLLADAYALGELQAYELERLPSGRFRYGAPEGMHDDTVIARALAWQAAQRHVELRFL